MLFSRNNIVSSLIAYSVSLTLLPSTSSVRMLFWVFVLAFFFLFFFNFRSLSSDWRWHWNDISNLPQVRLVFPEAGL